MKPHQNIYIPMSSDNARVYGKAPLLIVALLALFFHSAAANPSFLKNLEVDGSLTVIENNETIDGVVFYGTFDGVSTIPETGAGTRFMWYPKRAALRSGEVTGTQWDDAGIGDFSVAMGYNPEAAGRSSVALGEWTKAYSLGSAAIGYHTSALGLGAFAVGNESFADGEGAFAAGSDAYAVGRGSVSLGDSNVIFGNEGNFAAGSSNLIDESTRSIALGYANIIEVASDSFALGRSNSTTGVSSIALGSNLTNSVYSSLVIGNYNSPVAGSESTWVPSDPLFVIGNGTSGNDRSNALIVQKSGDTEIFGALDVADNTTIAGNLTVLGALIADISLPDDLSFSGNVGIGVPPDSIHSLDVAGSIRSSEGVDVGSNSIIDSSGSIHVSGTGVDDNGHIRFGALNDSLLSTFENRVTLHQNRAEGADKGFGIRSHLDRTVYRWEAYFGSGGNYVRGDLDVGGTIDIGEALEVNGGIRAGDRISSEVGDGGNLITVFAANNEADEPGTGVRIALSNALEGLETVDRGGAIDAIRQEDGSNDLVLSSASDDALNEIIRLRGADRTAVVQGDAEIHGDVAITGAVTIAHVPPQGGIMMGEFGFAD